MLIASLFRQQNNKFRTFCQQVNKLSDTCIIPSVRRILPCPIFGQTAQSFPLVFIQFAQFCAFVLSFPGVLPLVKLLRLSDSPVGFPSSAAPVRFACGGQLFIESSLQARIFSVKMVSSNRGEVLP